MSVRRDGPIAAFAPVALLAALPVLAALWKQGPCLDQGWGGREPFWRFCYSDLVVGVQTSQSDRDARDRRDLVMTLPEHLQRTHDRSFVTHLQLVPETQRARRERAGDHGADDLHAHPLTPGASHAPDKPAAPKPTSHKPYSVTTDAQAQAMAEQFIADSEKADQAIAAKLERS